jgi:hypothetical protein
MPYANIYEARLFTPEPCPAHARGVSHPLKNTCCPECVGDRAALYWHHTHRAEALVEWGMDDGAFIHRRLAMALVVSGAWRVAAASV